MTADDVELRDSRRSQTAATVPNTNLISDGYLSSDLQDLNFSIGSGAPAVERKHAQSVEGHPTWELVWRSQARLNRGDTSSS